MSKPLPAGPVKISGASEQEGDVVAGVGAGGGQDRVAKVAEWLIGGGGEGAGEAGHTGVDVLAGLVDEAVGVQGEGAAGGSGVSRVG